MVLYLEILNFDKVYSTKVIGGSSVNLSFEGGSFMSNPEIIKFGKSFKNSNELPQRSARMKRIKGNSLEKIFLNSVNLIKRITNQIKHKDHLTNFVVSVMPAKVSKYSPWLELIKSYSNRINRKLHSQRHAKYLSLSSHVSIVIENYKEREMPSEREPAKKSFRW